MKIETLRLYAALSVAAPDCLTRHLSVISVEAGIRIWVDKYSRLRGNDRGNGLDLIYQGINIGD